MLQLVWNPSQHGVSLGLGPTDYCALAAARRQGRSGPAASRRTWRRARPAVVPRYPTTPPVRLFHAAEALGKIKAVGDTPTDNITWVFRERPKPFGPRRRWRLLALWAALLLAVLVGQRATAHSFDHGEWSPSGPTEATDAEVLWY